MYIRFLNVYRLYLRKKFYLHYKEIYSGLSPCKGRQNLMVFYLIGLYSKYLDSLPVKVLTSQSVVHCSNVLTVFSVWPSEVKLYEYFYQTRCLAIYCLLLFSFVYYMCQSVVHGSNPI